MHLKPVPIAVLLLVGLTVACGEDSAQGETARSVRSASDQMAEMYGDDSSLTAEELERGRLDPSWRRSVQLDSADWSGLTPNPERWEEISAQAVNTTPMHLPLHGDISGPSVLRIQILLDRVLFSPGVMDGRWGKNTEKAIYWFQRREELRATGTIDQETFDRLVALAGNGEPIVEHTLTPDGVNGPFVQVPEDIYAKAELDCLCYTSAAEEVAEMFHTTRELLTQLNPGVNFDTLRAGTRLMMPNVRDGQGLSRLNTLAAEEGVSADSVFKAMSPQIAMQDSVARIVVSDGGHYVHALNAQGRILYHFPSTLGSDYNPSPSGDYHVNSVTFNPWWHFQPDLIEGADPGPDAQIPPGPNNAVGIVWMDLSKPHYGIHGTSAPETIGYTTSSGCVRLTNWDAMFLAKRVSPNTPVEFRDAPRGGMAAR